MLEEIIQIGNLVIQRRYILYIRLFFSIVLISSLTSYLYVTIFGAYDFSVFSDYEKVIIFFLSGEFVKVSSIFFLSFLITNVLSTITFEIFDYLMKNKFISAIKEAGSMKELEDLESALNSELNKGHLNNPPKLFLTIYPYFRDFTESDEFYEVIQSIEGNKHELRNTFLFVVRVIVCLVFYLGASIIGIGMFIVLILFCILFLFLLIYLNQFYTLLPELIELAKIKLDAYYKHHALEENQNG